jgi:prepilin-type N-terminal cleavage/methylation domain-containing protein
MTLHRRTLENGFTLIELSIVLVIIGLIIGGVMVGQDLIAASEIRSTISQVEKYNTEVNTFSLKYNGLPGDLPAQQAISLGFFEPTNCSGYARGSTGCGDGNGIIDYDNSVPRNVNSYATSIIGEELLFWRHLSDARLIDGSYGIGSAGRPGHINNSCQPDYGAVTLSQVQSYIPAAKIGRGNSFIVFAYNQINYYVLTVITQIFSFAGSYYHTGSGNITGYQAFQIDTKLDDGLPFTGTVHAGSALPFSDDLTPTTCTLAPTNTYNLGTIHLIGPGCQMSFKFN